MRPPWQDFKPGCPSVAPDPFPSCMLPLDPPMGAVGFASTPRLVRKLPAPAICPPPDIPCMPDLLTVSASIVEQDLAIPSVTAWFTRPESVTHPCGLKLNADFIFPTMPVTYRVLAEAVTGTELTFDRQLFYLDADRALRLELRLQVPPIGGGSGASVRKYWNGVESDCRPVTPEGQVWEVVDVTIAAGVIEVYQESRCVAFSATPGYCPYSGDAQLLDENGDPIDFTFNNGYAQITPGTVIMFLETSTGNTILLEADGDGRLRQDVGGELQPYIGIVGILNPDSGETDVYRIGSDGRLRQ